MWFYDIQQLRTLSLKTGLFNSAINQVHLCITLTFKNDFFDIYQKDSYL
jgi:hypothetical protein